MEHGLWRPLHGPKSGLFCRKREIIEEPLLLAPGVFPEGIQESDLRHPTTPRALVGGEVLFACPESCRS